MENMRNNLEAMRGEQNQLKQNLKAEIQNNLLKCNEFRVQWKKKVL